MHLKRNHSMDLLRILCTIFIVFIHVTPEYNPSDNSSWPGIFIHSLVRSGLPIFFIMSGYFILNSNIKSALSFYRSRFISIIIPFIVFSFAHYCYFHQWDSNPYSLEWGVNFIKSIIYGSPINFGREYFMTGLYWFVYAIIGLYLLSPAMIKCMDFINENNALKCVLILVFSYCILWVLGSALGKLGLESNWLQYPNNIKWLFYFLVGGVIRRINIKTKTSYSLPSIIITYALVVITCYGSAKGEWYSSSWIDANAAMVLFSVCLFATFHGLEINFKKNYVTYLSSLTYGVYLIHIVFLSVVSDKTHVLSNNLIIYTLVTGSAVVTLAFIASAAVNFIIINKVMMLLK